ncbi:hypothetical protein GCM10007979_45880 [Nocardioides albus]|nr:hypothetical protein GCM10007979_45880 [Nocardioides albus]
MVAVMNLTGSTPTPDEPTASSPSAPSASPDSEKDAPNAADTTPDLSDSTGLSAGALTAAAKKASVEPATVADATTSIDTALDSFFAPLEEGEKPEVPNVGKALADEIEIVQYERQDAGWTITGTPTMDDLEVVEVDDPSKPKAMTIRACVDTSDVTIKNSTGRDMTTKTATRSRSVFEMDLVKGEWRVTSRSLAGNADCSA